MDRVLANLVTLLYIWAALHSGLATENTNPKHRVKLQYLSSLSPDESIMHVTVGDEFPMEEILSLVSYLASLSKTPNPTLLTFMVRHIHKFHVINLPSNNHVLPF